MGGVDKIRIMVVDDHLIARVGVTAIIDTQRDLAVVAQAASGRQALEMFREHRPDVTLMDLRLPDMNGVEAIVAIREEFPRGRVIVLTNYDGDEDIYRALQAGAQSYLLKGVLSQELLGTIRKVYAGQTSVPPEIRVRLNERMAKSDLTSRETEVLKLIADGLTNKEIAAKLNLTDNTVRIYVSNILNKLGVVDRTQAATSAIRRGIIQLG